MSIKYIQIQGSSLCDGKCKICPYKHSQVARLKTTMSLSQFKLTLTKIHEYIQSPQKICLYLMSDSFFDKYLLERVDLTHEVFPDTLIEISTAFGAGSDGFIREVVNALLDKKHEIWISIHGINEQTYSFLCERDFHKVVERSIKLIKYSSGRNQIKFVGCGYSKDGQIRVFSAQDYIRFISSLVRKAGVASVRNIKISYIPFHNRAGNVSHSCWHPYFRRQINVFTPHFCSRPYDWLHILANGDVVPCCMNYNLSHIFGNIFKQSLEEIWSGEERQAYILSQLGFEQGNIPCRYCMSPGG
ncbi:MAG: hypothetical protein QIT35_gp46 [Methanophagales virus PBV299]|uniref:4Fe4S-binding SPASM domain-containing protein n=1 Tax=Methanophagales virus PBV299 TaxID=2987730 RepID=A0ABY6GN42_9CAUD|nr:MAG: hypothetical protein QIT35_gp46 [Methanophagales virus PBV299]UYL64842.1 MAG: hypothetical protein OFDIEDLO_00046 [Methanophagales virus PBV299]